MKKDEIIERKEERKSNLIIKGDIYVGIISDAHTHKHIYIYIYIYILDAEAKLEIF